MGQIIPTFTDFAPPCGDLNQTFLKMLANCIVLHDGHYYLNSIYTSQGCDDLEGFYQCGGKEPIDPEADLVGNLFAIDECGNLAIKILLNLGAA